MPDITQQFRIAEIEVAKSHTDDKIVGIFRFDNGNRAKAGPTLLIIAEIHSTLYAYERLLDVLNATAEQARHLVQQMDQDPLGRFEKLVQRMNECVASFVAEEATPLNWNRINIFAIELSDGHMCFTGTGKLTNLFLQKQEDGTFKGFDLFGSLEQPVQADTKKPFASIICGDIKAGDLLFAGTTNFERFRTELRLKERLTTVPPVTAALEIRQDLEKRGIPDDFVAAIIACLELKNPMAEPPPAPPIVETKDPSTASVEKLRSTEQEATDRLAPSISPIKSITSPRDMLTAVKSISAIALKKIGTLGKRFVKKDGVRDPVALASLRGMSAGYGTVFTRKKKLILYSAGALLVVIIGGTIWWNHAKKVAAEVAAWNSSFDGATDLRNRAESDLVYGNESRARMEIDQSEKTSSSLVQDTPDRQIKMQKLAKDLTDLKERLKKVVKQENVAELVSLGAAVAPGSLVGAVLSKDIAYVADESSNELLKISLTTKETKRIPLPSGYGNIVSAADGKDSVLFATRDGKLLALNKTTDLVKPMPWSHAKTSSTKDIVLYTSKLYSLDPEHSQIWRSTNSGGGFGAESAYIKASNATIENAVSLAIDSNVYILKSDGSLLEFLSGGQVSFGLLPIDPPLRAASSIWTDVDSASLYITDPADKRVLVYDKSGSLKSQITSTQFRELRDLSVNESDKRMIVVDGNRLLLVPLQ